MLTPEDLGKLDEFSKEDLIEYLLNRTDHGLVVLMDCDEEEGHSIKRKWKGNSHTCMGLASELIGVITNDLDGRYYREPFKDDN